MTAGGTLMVQACVTRVVLLGGMALHLEDLAGTEVVAHDLPRSVQRLVAHLGLAGRPGRSAVAGHLWPEVTEEQAHHNLRTTLWRVQKRFPGLVDASNGNLSLTLRVRVDVRELAEWGGRVLAPDLPIGDGGVALRTDLYGELLPGWYDEWVLLERERLRQLGMHVREALSGKLAAAGRFGEAVEAAHAVIVVAPLRESAHLALIRAHAAEGNIGEALLAYERYADRLGDEMALTPSARLETLVRGLTQRRER